MTDHAEEQEMEAEAMAAIFDTNFEDVEMPDTQDRVWRITIYPEAGTTDIQELERLNHVGCRLVVTLPETYPEIVPYIRIEIVKGLAAEHQDEIQQLAMDEATNNIGTPSIYAITERVREWLIENNTKGLDDISMHAQMIRKKLHEENSKVRLLVSFCNYLEYFLQKLCNHFTNWRLEVSHLHAPHVGHDFTKYIISRPILD
jgi:hypothetical protein